MGNLALRTMTTDEFIAWKAKQFGKHEYLDGEIVAMPGGTRDQDRVRNNIVAAHAMAECLHGFDVPARVRARRHCREVHRRFRHGGIRRTIRSDIGTRNRAGRAGRGELCVGDVQGARPSQHRVAGGGDPPIAMRVGIFTGSMVAGSLGGADRVDYTVLGDT
jgi:hypothetical protein